MIYLKELALNIFLMEIYKEKLEPNGNELYEGEFKEDIPKEGKKVKIYYLNGHLKYEGDIYNFK